MKKLAAILLALMLMVSSATAMKGAGYPAFDGTLKENSLGGQFGEDSLLLEFDPGAEYSYLRDGYIQGCFFTFDEAEEYYLELYLLLPEEVKSGDMITPESAFSAGASSCSITLFEVDEDNNETAWFAGQLLGSAYPENSGYTITIDRADYSEENVAVSGSIDASLCRLEGDLPSAEFMQMTAQFSFVLPLGNAPEAQPAPKAEKPAPAFTLPPDYITL